MLGQESSITQLLGADNGDTNLIIIDASTGESSIVASDVGGGAGFGALARNPVTGVLYGSQAQGRSGLYTIDTQTYVETFVGNLGGSVRALAWSPDGSELYGFRDFTFGSIDPSTAAYTPIGDSSTGGSFVGGMAFQPGTGTLFAVTNNSPGLFHISLDDGSATSVGSPGQGFNSLEFLPDGRLLAGASRVGTNPGFLVELDPTTAAPTLIGPSVDYGSRNLTAIELLAPTATTIEGRHIFYNDSFFDNPTFGNNDDTAIDPTKVALLPGQLATKANYISYTQGINGIMVDIADPEGTVDAADFEFHDMGRDGGSEIDAPAPDSITVRPGEGVGGSDRVVMTWDTSAGAIFDTTWLRVTVLESVGLDAADVFYFGSAPGEGSGGEFAHVDPADELGARNNTHGFGNPATVDDPWDYNKDRFVDPVDQLFARNNGTGFTTRLNLFTAPAAAPLSAGRSASDEDSALPTAAALTGGESGWSSVDTGAVSDSANGGGSNAAADERLWSDTDNSGNEQNVATNWERGVDTVLEKDSLWLDDLWSDL
ncbi:MAG: hypothetical protein WDZ59_03200 [Pirellulales bacterium]